MRLFIAAVLPEAVLEALAETSARLRDAVRGRYVSPDSFHVTLAFLGDVPAGRIDAAADALDAGCRGFAPFDVELGAFGSFGKRSAATLWQGFADQGRLPELAGAVRGELGERGFDFDSKAFRAHVTLMRKADLSGGTLPPAVFAQGAIEEATLFRSDLSGARPVYEPIHTVVL